jgi:hypothetical protein
LRFFIFKTHATSFNFFSALLYTVKENGGKPARKPHPLHYGLRNPYRNLKSGELSRFAHKHQRNSMFMNSASVLLGMDGAQAAFGVLSGKRFLLSKQKSKKSV